MLQLNFRKYNFQIRKEKGKTCIFDIIRKKYLVATPEELVRQHLIHFFIEDAGYPRNRISVEKSLSVNDLQKRYDIVVHNQHGNPKLLAECKAPTIAIDDSTLQQVAAYNLTLKVPYLLLSNGIRHYCLQVDFEKKNTQELGKLPRYDDLIND